MSGLADIGVRIVAAQDGLSGNGHALIHELDKRLERLAEQGATDAIDLRGLPLSAADLQMLEDFLGVGEIEARIDALGLTRVYETAYAGIWRVTYYSEDGKVVADVLEVTRQPGIITTPPGDVADACGRLREALGDLPPLPGRSTNNCEAS